MRITADMRCGCGFLGIFTQVLCILLAFFTLAFGAQAPVIDSFTGSATSVTPGGTVSLGVSSHDPDCAGTCTTGCGLYIRSDLTAWTATGGTFPTVSNGTSASPYSAAAEWQAPLVEGTYKITVSLSDSGTSFGCGGRLTTTANFNVLVTTTVNHPPEITSLTAEATRLFIDQSTGITAYASDPDGDPITYSWTTTIGSLSPGFGGTAIYLAPNNPGIAKITCTVTDDKGAFTTNELEIAVMDAIPEKFVSGGLIAPQRIAADSYGYLYVVDRSAGGIQVFNAATGTIVYRIYGRHFTSVAVDWSDQLLLGHSTGVQILDRTGNFVEFLNPGESLGSVQDVAVDVVMQRYAVLYRIPGRIVVFDANGTMLFAFGSNGDNPGEFKGAVSLAVTPGGEFAVADNGHGSIHIFDSNGNFVRSFGSRGSGYGKFTQLQGVSVDETGIIYASDAFQSQLQVFNVDGTFREALGEYGRNLGEFMTPTGLTMMNGYKKLVVTSLNAPSLQFFQLPGSTNPPVNTPPTTPTPVQPPDGKVFPPGSTILLEVNNSFDPDYQWLQYAFELYTNNSGTWTLKRSWLQGEGQPTTKVDATADVAEGGSFQWRVRASDGLAYSEWTQWRTFQVEALPVNRPPGAPAAMCPSAGMETGDLVPYLNALNAADPNGDPLTYVFEVSLIVNGVYQTIAVSPQVEEGALFTSWQVPVDILKKSQQVYWRAKANDGVYDSEWSEYSDFRTPPIAIPAKFPYGNVPGQDQTRPGEVRYSLDPRAVDTTLTFQVYDITSDNELVLEVNGLYLYPIPPLASNDWSATLSVVIPANELDAINDNRFRLLHSGLLDYWGVQKMTANPAPATTSAASKGKPKPNSPPGIPVPVSPLGGMEVPDLLPLLKVGNTTDPEGNALSYVFEVALLINGCYQPLTVSSPVAQTVGTTSWQIPAGVLQLSQQVYWRSKAYDGTANGAWTAYNAFWTPPLPVPSEGAYGQIPGGDLTRPAEVRYIFGPQSSEVTIYLQAFDIALPNELILEANGNYMHSVPEQIAGDWSSTISIVVPASELNPDSPNRIRFVHSSLLDSWGIRQVTLNQPFQGEVQP